MPPDRPVAQSHATGGLQWLRSRDAGLQWLRSRDAGLQWLRSRDAGLSALRRAGRPAIVMPAMFALFATPYRPTGLTTAARILVRLVDELVWLDTILERMSTRKHAGPAFSAVWDVRLAAAVLLEQGAALLEAAHGPPDAIEPALRELRVAQDTMEQAAMSAISAGRDPAGRGGPAAPGAAAGTSTADYVSSPPVRRCSAGTRPWRTPWPGRATCRQSSRPTRPRTGGSSTRSSGT